MRFYILNNRYLLLTPQFGIRSITSIVTSKEHFEYKGIEMVKREVKTYAFTIESLYFVEFKT